jgi:hypothetical protein
MEHKIFQTQGGKTQEKNNIYANGISYSGIWVSITYNWDIMEYDWDIVKD